jgi:hypothetical protein
MSPTTSTRRLVTATLLLALGGAALLVLPPRSEATEPAMPRPPAGRRPAAAGPRDGELHEALRDYYVHFLRSELGVTDAAAPAFEKAVRDLLARQRRAGDERRRLLDELRAGVGPASTAPDAEAARSLATRLEEQDARAAKDLRDARAAVIRHLDDRAAVRFLASEERFRQRVRQLAAAAEGRGEVEPAPRPPGPPRQGAWGPGRPAGRDRVAPPPGPPEDPDEGVDDPRNPRVAEAVETMKLLYAHELRSRLGLDRTAVLDLLPDLDALVDLRVDAVRERRDLMRELRRGAWTDVDGGGATSALVLRALDQPVSLQDRLAAARRKVLARLGPVDGARFLLVDHHFEMEARRRLQDLVQRARPPARHP